MMTEASFVFFTDMLKRLGRNQMKTANLILNDTAIQTKLLCNNIARYLF